MNYRLLAEIINSPWLIDKEAAMGYTALLRSLLTDTRIDERDLSQARAENKTFVVSAANKVGRWSLNDENIPDGSTAIIPIRGEIMKYDQECGPRGTMSILNDFKTADANKKITSIMLVIDSPGGQVTHTDVFAKAIKDSSTPVLAFVEGMAASGAYWIASSASKIIASSNLDKVGSIGTMLFFADMQPYYEEQGVKFHEFYATKSTDKNKDVNDVLDGKYDNYRKNTLDVINEEFHAAVRDNRPGVSKDVFSGKTYFSNDAIDMGLIDEIGTFDYALEQTFNLPNNNVNRNSNSSDMKIKIKSTWAAIIAFFKFDAAKENEIDAAQVEELNNELQLRGDSIATLTSERDQARTELASSKTAKETAEAALATANTSIATLTTENGTLKIENAALKVQAGAPSATVVKENENGDAGDGKDADAEFCATHTMAENVAYLRSKR